MSEHFPSEPISDTLLSETRTRVAEGLKMTEVLADFKPETRDSLVDIIATTVIDTSQALAKREGELKIPNVRVPDAADNLEGLVPGKACAPWPKEGQPIGEILIFPEFLKTTASQMERLIGKKEEIKAAAEKHSDYPKPVAVYVGAIENLVEHLSPGDALRKIIAHERYHLWQEARFPSLLEKDVATSSRAKDDRDPGWYGAITEYSAEIFGSFYVRERKTVGFKDWLQKLAGVFSDTLNMFETKNLRKQIHAQSPTSA